MSALAAVYGSEYLRAYQGRKNLGFSWFFFNLLVAGMVLVVVARNAVLFLVAWEVMSLASFFLVTFENEKAEVREAGWTYLVATHLGTAFLLVDVRAAGRASAARWTSTRFGGRRRRLGIAGVRLRAGGGRVRHQGGLHAAARLAARGAPGRAQPRLGRDERRDDQDGHLRPACATLTFLGPPPRGGAGCWSASGVVSGVLGVLFALAQHDLKRLLAYHSVENIGIIALGLGRRPARA